VINVQTREVKAAPDLGSQVNIEYIQGLATIADRMVMLLDIDRLISADIMDAAAMVA